MKKTLFAAVFILARPMAWAAPGDDPYLAVAQSPTATVYLFGSIHVATPDVYPLPDKVEKAFQSSTLLAVEVNISSSTNADALGAAAMQSFYIPPDSLDKHLTPATWAMAKNWITKHGLPLEQFQQIKPWALAVTISAMAMENMGLKSDEGIDRHFLRQAEAAKKPVIEIEYVEDQMGLLDVSDKEQEIMLKSALEEADQLGAHTERLLTAWRKGDLTQLEALLKPLKEEEKNSSLYGKVFDDRNAKMAAQVEEFLRGNVTVFVVVGAGHMAGPTGLIKTLQKKYSVKRL